MPQFLLRGVLTRWLFAIGLSLSAAIQAANPVTEVYFPDLPKGTVGLGVGVRFSDSPYVGIDDAGSTAHSSSYDLLPYYYYEGDYLFYHGSTAGIHLLDNDSFRLDTLLSYRFDQLESARDDYFRTVEDREQTLEAGFEGAFKGDWGELSLSWVKDAQGRHSGEEIDLGYRFDWHQDEWMLSPFVSYVYQDQNLSNYYYGVSEAESRPDLPAYSADHATILRVGMNTSYQLSPRLRLYANVSIDQLDDTVTASPLVDEDFVPSAMMGVFYEFGSTKNEEALAQSNPERVGEWSWRLNYGYTTESTFNAVHRGDFRRDKDVDTNLLGLTLGKLLLDGDRVDFWGKLSLNRRLEKDFQDDFFEINAYVMAMGTGYSPWTSKELFRYGFGYGFSYADSVPAVEKLKQEDREKASSQFLNYLEAQLDIPLRNAFGTKGWWKNCYSGVTLVHRSGIFGRSDILGNVDGGSNVLTAHLECKG